MYCPLCTGTKLSTLMVTYQNITKSEVRTIIIYILLIKKLRLAEVMDLT